MPLGLFQDENAQALDSLYRGTPLVPQPGFFSGALTAPFMGAAEGAGKIVQPLVDQGGVDILGALSPVPDIYSQTSLVKDDEVSPGYSASSQAQIAQAMKQFQADPLTVGRAGQIMHGVSSFGTRFVMGSAVGGPLTGAALVGGTEGYSQYQESLSEGLDEKTAKKLAVADGLMSGAMSLLPAGVAGKVLVRVGSGAAINVGAGGLNRFVSHQILADAGYPEQASQYRVLDGQAMAADAVLGAVFGGVFGHRPAAPASAVDAAHTTADAAQVETDLAPGIPKTATDRNNQVRNLQDTVAAVARGDEVTPPLRPVETVPNPEQAAAREAADAEAASAVKEQGVSLSEPPDAIEAVSDIIARVKAETEAVAEQPKSALSRATRQEQAKAAEAQKLSELDPEIQEAAGQAEDVLQRNEGLQLKQTDEAGNESVVDAKQALRDALAEAHSAGEEGEWGKIAAACFARG